MQLTTLIKGLVTLPTLLAPAYSDHNCVCVCGGGGGGGGSQYEHIKWTAKQRVV